MKYQLIKGSTSSVALLLLTELGEFTEEIVVNDKCRTTSSGPRLTIAIRRKRYEGEERDAYLQQGIQFHYISGETGEYKKLGLLKELKNIIADTTFPEDTIVFEKIK